MTDGDIHRLNNRLKNQVKTIQNSSDVSEYNKKQLSKFRQYMESQGLTPGRISRYLSIWRIILEKGDENLKLDKAKKEDIIRIVGKINQGKIKEMAPGTKKEYKKGIRKFYTDYMESIKSGFDGEDLCDFFTLTIKKSYLDPKQIPKPKHIEKMVKQASRTRDKAFIMTLWSTGGRIGEILGLKWKDIELNHNKAKLVFRDTKTKDDRVIPLLEGYVYLKELKNKDHKGDNPESFVFRGLRSDKQLTHNGGSQILKRIREKTDIPERIKTNPHSFRKARATYLAGKLTDQELCKFFGWVPGSEQPRRYIRMGEKDLFSILKTWKPVSITYLQPHIT